MASIKLLQASDGTGNASTATVTMVRTAGSSTIHVDTVENIPDFFNGTMGTPHTFTDPVTGETITVISEATAVDFQGHPDSGNIEIDTIADGYTDLGSAVGDIVVIKPTTQWAEELVGVLQKAHNDDGSLKNAAIIYQPLALDHVASGCVWSGDSYGSTKAASMTSGSVYINGALLTVAAVTARVFTASRDTYVYLTDNGDGTAAFTYQEVTNNNASPAAPSNSVLIAIIVTGASNIANAGSVNQGQDEKVLPIASSIPYCICDSLGNRICRRNPTETRRGFMTKTSSSTLFTTGYVTFLTVVAKSRGRSVMAKYDALIRNAGSGAGNNVDLKVQCDGVDVTPNINVLSADLGTPNEGNTDDFKVSSTPAAGVHTWTLQGKANAGSSVYMDQANLEIEEP